MSNDTALEMMDNALSLLFTEYVKADRLAQNGQAPAENAARRDAYAHALEMMGAIHMAMQEEAGQR